MTLVRLSSLFHSFSFNFVHDDDDGAHVMMVTKADDENRQRQHEDHDSVKNINCDSNAHGDTGT